MRRLCRFADMMPGASRGFGPPPGGFTGLFAIRQGDDIFVYVNACPHLGVGLDAAPDSFLTHDASQVMCSTHGALFTIGTGLCVRGPCKGGHLERVPVSVEDGWVLVPEDAGL